MKKIILKLTACCLFSTAYTQNNIATSYCDHGDLNASRYEPSELDFHNKKVQLGFNYYLWTGNTAINYADVQEIYKQKKVLDSKVDEMIGSMKETNIFGVGQDFQVFGLGIQFRSKKDPNKKLDFSLQVVDKFGMNLQYSKNLFSLLWKGNKQFAGQTVELGPLAVNANYSREFVLGSAFNLFGNEEDGGMRMGFRAKYIQGIGAVYMPKSNLSLYTDPEGKYLELSTDYQAYSSGLKDYSAFAMNGTGMGLDLGVTGYLNKHWEFSGSLLDLGQINYKNNNRSFSNNGKIRYDGLIINDLFGSNGNPEYADTAVNIFTPQETNQAFKMGLGTKIVIQAEFKTWRELKRKSEKAEARLKEREVVSNGFFLTYVQGLNNMPGATTRPFFSFGYHRNLWDVFDIGLSAAYGGYNNFMMGAFFDLNIAHTFKIGVGSDNLTGFIMPKSSTGIDASINVSVAF